MPAVSFPAKAVSKEVSLLKSCSHKARLVTHKIQNKNTNNTNTHAGPRLPTPEGWKAA